jgi:hypothetical protein
MAALTATKVGDRTPAGRYWEQTYSVALTGSSPADEWFVTGYDEVIAVRGIAAIGTAGPVDWPASALNKLGTGGATSLGALGIESVAAQTVHVTLLLRGA